MPAETTNADGTQAAPPASPQAGDPPAQVADAQQLSTGSAEGEGPDAAALTRELAAARREAASYRTRLKAFEDGQKTEIEKATDRIAELERENADLKTSSQESTVRMSVLDAATRLGFRSPELAYRALDRALIEFKADGTPQNVDKLLRDLLEREPYLGKPGADFGGGPRGSTPANTPSMNEILRAARNG